MAARPIYGYVYELILAGQSDTDHSYVGMTTTTIHRRVHGSSGHTSARDVAHDPWKAGIRPGRDGYRCLEIVRSTGDQAEDDRALRRAEAFWIDRLRPVHNDVRPVRPAGERIPSRPRRSAQLARGTRRPVRRRRRRVGKPIALALLIAACTYLSAYVLLMMELPWPQVPWVGAPVLGVALGWSAFWRAHRSLRRLFR
jgi:hypothetical protein